MTTSIQDKESSVLSPFLQKMVREQVIPEKIAEILNNLPTTALQAQALNQLREQVSPLAEQIVHHLIYPPATPKTSFSNDVLPWWLFYPYSEKIKSRVHSSFRHVK